MRPYSVLLTDLCCWIEAGLKGFCFPLRMFCSPLESNPGTPVCQQEAFPLCSTVTVIGKKLDFSPIVEFLGLVCSIKPMSFSFRVVSPEKNYFFALTQTGHRESTVSAKSLLTFPAPYYNYPWFRKDGNPSRSLFLVVHWYKLHVIEKRDIVVLNQALLS